MARRKKAAINPHLPISDDVPFSRPMEPIDAAPGVISGAPAAPAEDRSTPIKRVSFPVDDNGNINWEGMRTGSAAELRDLLKRTYQDANFLGELGVEQKPVANIFDEEWTGSIFDALGAVESLIAQRMFGIPQDIARECFTYNEAEKSKLAGPAAKVINKYATRYDFLVTFKEEISLGILLFAITSVKLKMAQIRTEVWRASQKARANGAEKVIAVAPDTSQDSPVQ